MSFYIKPPSGLIPLKKLESYAVKRFHLLQMIASLQLEHRQNKNDVFHFIVNDLATVSNSECIISGTQKDEVSHFILRLIMSQDEETSRFLHQTEIALFELRSQCMTEDELYQILKCLNTIISRQGLINTSPDLMHISTSLSALKKQCNNSWKYVAHKFFKFNSISCSQTEYFEVPFQTVLPLVYKRKVILRNGVALVPFSELLTFLSETFSSLLKMGIAQARVQDGIDYRLNQVSKIIMKQCKTLTKHNVQQKTSMSNLNKDELDLMSQTFPPCMLNLHNTLRERHRLNHHARIQYTLFLKEMGLPVDEALIFWKGEYSQPASRGTVWGTDWKIAHNKYTYNIQHLYGLEGSRRNYRAHCCQSIQAQIMGPTDAGGCPFVHFDNKHFQQFLQQQYISAKETQCLEKLCYDGKFQEACSFYKGCKIGQKEAEIKTKMSDNVKFHQKVIETHNTNNDFNGDQTSEIHGFLKYTQVNVHETSSVKRKKCELIQPHCAKKLCSKNKICDQNTKDTSVNTEQTGYSDLRDNTCAKIKYDQDTDWSKSKLPYFRNRDLERLPIDYSSDDDQSNFGCDHDNCASQKEQNNISSNMELIQTPIDYCVSYNILIEKLHENILT